MRERHLPNPRLAKTMLRGAENVRQAAVLIRKKDTVTEQMQEELRAASAGVLRVTASSLRCLKPALKYREKRRQKSAVKEKAGTVFNMIGRQSRQAVPAKPMSQSNQIAAAKHADNARRMQARLQSVTTRVRRRTHR